MCRLSRRDSVTPDTAQSTCSLVVRWYGDPGRLGFRCIYNIVSLNLYIAMADRLASIGYFSRRGEEEGTIGTRPTWKQHYNSKVATKERSWKFYEKPWSIQSLGDCHFNNFIQLIWSRSESATSIHRCLKIKKGADYFSNKIFLSTWWPTYELFKW